MKLSSGLVVFFSLKDHKMNEQLVYACMMAAFAIYFACEFVRGEP